ncbi:hypothetical protein PRZ48_010914 [Zasmidium cellare]|uniref:NAD(P)-binding domain-containing protein n=1 Tax=Zasmidium cellare TaxID=395010 RepID=A0ABR0E9Y8_ZASCE|nr:hypothetical protein PRZ48_010914 [Zasmidium cellare]
MAPKIFITGGTGYIGGTVLDTIVKKHPEYEITALLRSEPEDFAKTYPNVKVVRGDYDSADVLSEAASKADVVVHNGNSDHVPSIKALIDGSLKSDKPTFLLHLSGTGLIADWRDPSWVGKLNPKTWSDVDDIREITTRPDGELHRHVDKIILAAAQQHGEKLKTAIICPPDIYGPGRGLKNKHTVYFPVFLKEIEKIGRPFYGNEGENVRSWVHIEDLMKVYRGLVESAVAGGEGADWGVDGYYFAATQSHSQRFLAERVAAILGTTATSISSEEIDKTMAAFGVPHLGTYMFGANSRSKADRAGKNFGYEASAPGLWEVLEEEVRAAARLERISFQGHTF